MAQALIHALPDWRQPRGFMDLGSAFITQCKHQDRFTLKSWNQINLLLITELALQLPNRIMERNLPQAILDLYSEALERLESFICTEPIAYYYPNEYFLKDLRFVSGLTVPCGAFVADLRSIMGWKPGPSLLKNKTGDIYKFIKHYKKKPWVRGHLESRYINEFNAQGMNKFFLRVALLLEAQPELHGFVATSWFYDKKLKTISPHLNFLYEYPVLHGAFIIRGSASAYDIQASTLKSLRRRNMYEEGSYKPVCCLLVWPKEFLLHWAKNQGCLYNV